MHEKFGKELADLIIPDSVNIAQCSGGDSFHNHKGHKGLLKGRVFVDLQTGDVLHSQCLLDRYMAERVVVGSDYSEVRPNTVFDLQLRTYLTTIELAELIKPEGFRLSSHCRKGVIGFREKSESKCFYVFELPLPAYRIVSYDRAITIRFNRAIREGKNPGDT